MPASTALADPTTVITLAGPPPTATAPDRVTLTVTIAGLFDVLTNTVRAIGTDLTLPSIARLRLHIADGRLHATATDRYRIHRDWTPLLDNTPAHLPDPLFLSTSDVATLRALLRRRLAPATRTAPATLTVGLPSPDGELRPVRLTVGSRRTHRDSLTVVSVADPDLPYPDIAALDARFPAMGATGAVQLNPQFIDDAGRLTHDGRPVSRRAGLLFHFRTARTDGEAGPIRITHPERPSWAADLMPIRIDQ
ncbi:putative DNA_pol3_beta_2 domain-containing protein [Frankia sp. Hr75.2]|nr:putative DNA_pol3_beta_2 domain-containing protein [Frankia sp. Hr75.2]